MIWKLLNSFANTDESLVLYEAHKYCPLVANFQEATVLQQYWICLMAGNDVNYKLNIEQKLIGIAKGVGIEFKNDTQGLRQSNSFREEMKQKQKERRKDNNG